MDGMREFVPDFSMIVKPILGIGDEDPARLDGDHARRVLRDGAAHGQG